jgi:hypothetical protein
MKKSIWIVGTLVIVLCAISAWAGPFTATNSMTIARRYHTATLLPNGKVLIAGGNNAPYSFLNTADIYDPATGTFTATAGNMTSARSRHTTTLLPNGKVLIVGGWNGSSYLNTAEVYDPTIGTFTATTGSMTSARQDLTATLLPNGKVLIAGGDQGGALNIAEVYDPATGTFTVTGNMISQRMGHTATLLPNGKVLIAGGANGNGFLNTAEVYDPTTESFTAIVGNMTSARSSHTATVLPNGKVLIAGGGNLYSILNTADIYDPATGTFTATVSMTSARVGHTSTLLPNGNVLIVGGINTGYLNTAEVYDSATGTFTATAGNMTSARFDHTTTLLPNGKVLIAGGANSSSSILNTAEVFDLATGTFKATAGNMTSARFFHSATLLPNGKVLIAGGQISSGVSLNTAEQYDSATGTLTTTAGHMIITRSGHSATLLRNGRVLITGGHNGSYLNTGEVYEPVTGIFTAVVGNMNSARYLHTATLLPNGKVLLAGGFNGSSPVSTAEVYDPATGSFAAIVGNMTSARYGHTATLLPDGKVLLAGGFGNSGYLNTAEVYDPATGSFAAIAGNMTSARYGHTATLLPDGKVLLAGGYDGRSSTNAAEVYDPATSSCTATAGNMSSARYLHTATQLLNGKILIAGGYSNSGYLNASELFDPTTGTFITIAGNMTSARYSHTATLLMNGKVLIAGGWSNTGVLNTAEEYDMGLGFSDSWRPVVNYNSPIIAKGQSILLTGSGFSGYGNSEGSDGTTNNSATNFPLVMLRSIDSGQTLWLPISPLTNGFATTDVTTMAINNFPAVPSLVTVFVNGIPSVSSYVTIVNSSTMQVEVPSITYGTNASVTVIVSSSDYVPTGSVDLSMDGGPVISQSLKPIGGSNPPAASAVFTITKPVAGTHTIVANYGYTGQEDFSACSVLTRLTVNMRMLTVTATVSNKVYDGTVNAVASYSDNRLAGDVFTVYGTAVFNDKNVGTGKTVSISSMYLSGNDAGNYLLASNTTSATANITAATVMPNVTVSDKTYDGTTASTITTRTLTGAIGDDDVTLTGGTATFADASVGTNKLVTVTGLTLAGTMAGNYQLSLTTATTHADIIAQVAAPGDIVTIAGGYMGDGGPATNAVLSNSYSVAVDGTGNIYIADTHNQRIRKVDASTGVITTVAGSGSLGFNGDNGLATSASLANPYGIAVDGVGNIYIADTSNNRIRKINISTGIITTVAGNGNFGFSGDNGPATSASLSVPYGVIVDSAGNIYIADSFNNRVRKVDASTGVITPVAGNGTGGFSGDNGPATSASLYIPTSVSVDSAGNIYIADSNNNRIRKVNASTGIITTVAGNGTLGFSGDNGPATSASIANPHGVSMDTAGNVYIADLLAIRKVNASTGIITTVAGNGTLGFSGDNGPATSASIADPHGVSIDAIGNIYIADTYNQRIRKVNASTGLITTVAGNGTAVGDNGPATLSSLYFPNGVSIDAAGNIYIADTNNNRIRKVDVSTGVITTVAGNGTQGFSGDNGAATSASLYYPTGVSVDEAGNIYIADSSNNRIRKVNASTGIIMTVAGNGNHIFSGDNSPATSASLSGPYGVIVDSAGNIYIADQGNHRIRKVSASTGVITTVAGNGTGGFGGDNGPATSASLYGPKNVTIDAVGNIYIADMGNHRIRKVNASTGIITTVAGNGTLGFGGDNGPATLASLFQPASVSIDSAGNIYIADESNQRIRKVNASTGVITTVAGIGPYGFSGDYGPATSASLWNPAGIAIDAAGNIFIADTGNNRIRKVIAGSNPLLFSVTTQAGTNGSISCNPTSVASGSSSVCTILPNAGYSVADVLVDGTSIGAVMSYTFSNVQANHTISASFGPAATTITLTQTVVNTAGVPVAGAQVSVVGNPSLSAITDANGTFVLPLPYGVNFAYSISATGYRVFYSGNFNFTSSTVLPNRTIYTDTEVMGWGVNPGYGALTGRAVDASTSQTINNPTITAASTLNPGIFYTVQYSSVCGTGSGTCSYKLINIAANDAVLLTVSAPGYITLQTQLNPLPADAVGNAYVMLTTQAVNPSVVYDLSLTMTGTGTGTITSSPGYNCSGTCRQEYSSGVMVSLDAVAAAGSTFSGWTGCDAVNGTTCSVSMTSARSVSADFSRQSVGTGTVYGRVIDSFGAGVSNALVRMIHEYDSTSCSGSSCLSVTTDINGSYLIGNLVPGTYITAFYNQPIGGMWTTNQYYNQKHSTASADLVTINESSITEIDVVYPAFGQISGTVTDINGVGIQHASVKVYNLDEEFIDMAWTDVSGYYAVQHVPSGTYKIRFSGPNLVTQLAYVTVMAPDSVTGINTALSPGRTISGRLTDRNGSPIVRASVNVFNLFGNNIQLALTDASGAYSALGIPSGNYVVLFKGPSAELYSRQFYGGSPTFSGASIVTVPADADVTYIDGILEATGPAVSVASKKDFGVEVMGMSSYRSFILTNSGTADLSISTLSETGEDFSLLNDRCSGVTLAPMKVCTFQVAFVPQSEGAKTGSVTIASNDPNVPLLTISLTGSGAAATGNSGTTAVPYGDNVVANPTSDVALVFNSVTSAEAEVTVTAVTTLASPAPSNFRMLNGASYDITTTASFSGPVTVCINYNPATVSNLANEQNLKLFHFDGTTWQDITTSVNTATHTICGVTISLSPFAVAEQTGVYTITATANPNGSITPLGMRTVNSGDSATYTITPEPGYKVQSVIVDGANKGSITSYMFSNVQTNHTIDAYFKAITYTITASAGAGGSISPPGVNAVNPGSSMTFTITPTAGYHIADVQVNGASQGAVASYTFTNITANHTIAATFAANPAYIINAGAGANGSISPSGAVSALGGTNQTFSIAPAAGYRVADVQVDGSSAGAVTSYTFNNVQAGHTISVTFTPDVFAITATADANGSITPSGVSTVNKGDSLTLSITPSAGYQVQSVIVDGANKGAITSYTFTNVQANHTIGAYFKMITYTLTASAGSGGSITPAGASTVNQGASKSFTITPAAGYHVADVLVDGSSVGALTTYAFDNITTDHTISATFAANTGYTIMVTAGANGSITPSSNVSVLGGSNQTFTITPASGYRVADLVVDGVSQGALLTSYTFYDVQAGHTISVTFTPDIYIITAAADVNGSITPSGVSTVNKGDSLTLSITPSAGYQVQSVIVDGANKGAITSYTFTNVQANHTVSAYFKMITYTITASAGSGGSITPAGTSTVNQGAGKSFTITSAAGYHVADVLVDGSSVGALTTYAFDNITANHTIAATFAANTSYTLTASASGNGTISPSGAVSALAGANKKFTFTPQSGYRVAGVVVDGVSKGALTSYTFYSVQADHTISVTFVIDVYTITAAADAGGSIDPSGTTTVSKGDSQTYTITPEPGRTVRSVIVDGANRGAITTFTFTNVTTNHTINAYFK